MAKTRTILLFFILGFAFSFAELPKLEHYSIDKDQISVSGISSGGYFAVQFHVAFSETIMGAGIFAAGPFGCAKNDILVALSACMTIPDNISVSELVSITYTTALSKTIDSPSNLKDDRIYLFSGTQDTVVDPGVVVKLSAYYQSFINTSGSLYLEFSIPAQHAMVTDSYGNECIFLGAPFINNCNYSVAYHTLQHIYGNIQMANSSQAIPENLLEFDQAEFFVDLPSAVSMDSIGYVYVPTACQSGKKTCRLHLAFHGCFQGRVFVSNEFALNAGYNGLAEVNNIIILYPQARNSTVLSNPNGCWDWWGYTGKSYASKLGRQMTGVKLMLDKVALNGFSGVSVCKSQYLFVTLLFFMHQLHFTM